MLIRYLLKSEGFGKFWRYFSNTITIISIISIVVLLKSWQAFAIWMGNKIVESFPVIANLINLIFTDIKLLIELYRSIVHPPLLWMFQWLPFDLHHIILDLAIILVFTFGSLIRVELKYRAIYSRNRDIYQEKIRLFLLENGIEVGPGCIPIVEWALRYRGNSDQMGNSDYDKIQSFADSALDGRTDEIQRLIQPLFKWGGEPKPLFGEKSAAEQRWTLFGITLGIWVIVDWLIY